MLIHLVIFGLKIKVLCCAHTGCKGRKNHAPGSSFMCSPSHKGINMLEKSLHTLGAQRLKSVHTVLKMGTPGAGCTLNFEH